MKFPDIRQIQNNLTIKLPLPCDAELSTLCYNVSRRIEILLFSICATRPDLGQMEPGHDKYFQQLVHLSHLGRRSPPGLVRAWRPHRSIRAGLRARPEMMSAIHPHLEKARLAAAGYAPAPEASALVYGLIGMALCSVGMWGAGLFYDLPLMPHLSLVVAGSLIAFPIGILLRSTRKRRHADACQLELARPGEECRS